MPYIPPEQYEATSAYDLLQAASEGFIGFDQRLIHALVDNPDRTLPELVRFTKTEEVPWDLLLDFVAIFRRLHTPEAVPLYIAAIRKTLGDIPDELTEAVVELGQPMLDPLLKLYEEIGEDEGGEIAFMLAGLGIRDQRIFDLLVERLEYEAGDGALSLSLYGDPAAIPHIQRILDEVPETDTHLRHELQGAIAQIEADQSIAPLAPEPFDIFELYPAEAGPNFELLSQDQRLSLIAGTPPEVRAEAAANFRNDDLSQRARDRLFDLAKLDPEPHVRSRAWEALASRADESDIHAAMLEAARNAPVEERSGAVVALAAAPELDPEAIPLIEALYKEPGATAKALEAMWKSLDPRFRPYMIQHLGDPDEMVRHHAIYGIGYLGMGAEAPRLVPLFEDEDFRHDALLAYALAVPAEVSRSRMKPLFRRIETLAHGLTDAEAELVEQALDQRLELYNLKPVFHVDDEPEPDPEPRQQVPKVGRNDPCPCGSGKKYKKCHGA